MLLRETRCCIHVRKIARETRVDLRPQDFHGDIALAFGIAHPRLGPPNARLGLSLRGDRVIEFDIAYLLERADEQWRILAYISREDEAEAMQREGLL